jgi:hypothetical protein
MRCHRLRRLCLRGIAATLQRCADELSGVLTGYGDLSEHAIRADSGSSDESAQSNKSCRGEDHQRMTRRASSRSKRLGQSLIEFTFVGIPMMFILVSIFEISRGMWMYHTMAYSVKQGVRYALTHGSNCGLPSTNTCQVKMGPATGTCNTANMTIADMIRCAGVGLDPVKTLVTFTSGTGSSSPCTLDVTGGTNPCPATIWPPIGFNNVGDPISIKITTPFNSMIALFWPGAKPVAFGSATLGASSSDRIQF